MAAKTKAPESYDYVPHPHILKRKSHPAAPKPIAANRRPNFGDHSFLVWAQARPTAAG